MNLVDAMRSDFSASKTWVRLGLLVGAGVYLASVVATLLPPGADKTLAAIGFLAQIFTILARTKADDFYNCGETIRRMAMLQDGFGIQPSPLVIADLCARVCLPTAGKPAYIGTYYASQAPAGPKRAAKILLESAFWTRSLAVRTSRTMWCVVALATIVILFVAISFLLWDAQISRGEEIARVLLVSLGFWTVGDWTALAIKYQCLARSAEPVLNNTAEMLKSTNVDSNEALIQLGEYNVALACGPVIPEIVYMFYQNKLNHAWSTAYPNLK